MAIMAGYEKVVSTFAAIRPKTAHSNRKDMRSENRQFHLSEVLHQLGYCRKLVLGKEKIES